MSEGLIGSPTADQGVVSEVQSQGIPQETTTPQIGEQQNQGQDSQNIQGNVVKPEDLPGLIQRAERAEAEARRQREYNEFLRQTRSPEVQTKERKEFDPDAIPYVKDVNDLIDMRVEERLNAIQEQQVIEDLRRISDEKRQTDVSFDKRMSFAMEILERDEMLAPLFLREKTANGKIAFMERIAQWHPLYGTVEGSQPLPSQAQGISEAAQKLKAASQIPPSLSTMQAAGSAQKLVSQMTDEEYIAYFKNVTKGY